MEDIKTIDKGLENAEIEWTKLTTIDGEKGILMYGGYSIDDIIAHKASVEEIQYLFLYGELPTQNQFLTFLSSPISLNCAIEASAAPPCSGPLSAASAAVTPEYMSESVDTATRPAVVEAGTS